MVDNDGSRAAVNAFLRVINWCTYFHVSRGGLLQVKGWKVLGSNSSRKKMNFHIVLKLRMSGSIPVINTLACFRTYCFIHYLTL